MSSSHTVNTNKLPKVLKSRTPMRPPIPCPPWKGAGGCRQPRLCVLPRGEPGTDRTPRRKTQHLGLSSPHGLDRPQTDVLSLFFIAAVRPRGGRGGPGPFPDHLQSNLRYRKTSEWDKRSEEWGKRNKVTLLCWQLLPNLQTIWKLFIYKIIKISCPIPPPYLAVAGLLVSHGMVWGLWWRRLRGPQQNAAHSGQNTLGTWSHLVPGHGLGWCAEIFAKRISRDM